MVRLLYFLLIIILSSACHTKKQVAPKIEPNPFEISFEIPGKTKNSILCYGDSIDIIISLKNTTDSVAGLSGYVVLEHFRDFSAYYSGIALGIILNEDNRYNNPISIYPKDVYKNSFRVLVSKEFFDTGTNKLS
ncbi:MAG: hypothetical protein LIO93_03640, partial [Bacteroidales bacterium]|nr:hypothetical protein [Bacteroidales bacterium]